MYQIQLGLRLSYGFELNSSFSGNDENEEIVVEEELKDKVRIRDSFQEITRPDAMENRETRVFCGRKDESHIFDGIEIIKTVENISSKGIGKILFKFRSKLIRAVHYDSIILFNPPPVIKRSDF